MKRVRLLLLIGLLSICGISPLYAQFNLGVKVSYVTDMGFNSNWTLSDGKMNLKADPAQGFNEIGRAHV